MGLANGLLSACEKVERLADKVETEQDVVRRDRPKLSLAPVPVADLCRRPLPQDSAIRLIPDQLLPAMGELRSVCDSLEASVSREAWPYPRYSDLLFPRHYAHATKDPNTRLVINK